jgi:denticleless
VFDVIWSHDDRQLLTASGDLFVSGWDVETQRSVFKLQGHQMSVKCVRQVPAQAHLFASGARDGNVLIWDTRTNGKPVANLENVHSTPEPIASSSGSSTFTSPPSARKRRKPPVAAAPRSVTCIEFGAHGHELVTGGAVDSVVKFWDVRRLTTSDHFKPTAFSSRPVHTISCSSSSIVGGRANHGISSLAFDHTHSKLLVNVLNDAIKVIDIHAAPGTAPLIQCSGHLATSFYGAWVYFVSLFPFTRLISLPFSCLNQSKQRSVRRAILSLAGPQMEPRTFGTRPRQRLRAATRRLVVLASRSKATRVT